MQKPCKLLKMVLKPAKKFSLKHLKVSRVILISGLLTFMYCIEFCIGVRTIYYTFKLWSETSNKTQEQAVSWTLCVACLLTATITAFSVNVLSAMWEQKQLEDRKKDKSTIRFTFHIVTGALIWRYVNLWFIESKEFQKKSAILLTMTKFFFTQTFTIPMVIVHVSVMAHIEELIFDICSIFCISITLILTCTMFAWCSSEVEELKKWDFETVNLIPLMFQTSPSVTTEHACKAKKDPSGKEVVSKSEKKDANSSDFEDGVVRTIVFFQSFGFSLGRILALGILLKLAGIYAVSIMFLQLLISVIYLKFQSPILVSDSLPKWRQLCRLAFMSYILIFEWQLNRDPKTAYDFSFNMKHSILYYCVATVESVFYLVTWAVTTNFSTKTESLAVRKLQNKFCRTILIIGSLSLVFSLSLHILLLFWHSRRISVFMCSVRRRYESTKMRMSKYGCGNVKNKQENIRERHHIDISSPIPIKKNDESSQEQNSLEKHNSYRDLREPLDEEIEIHFQKCGHHGKEDSEEDKNSYVKYETTPEKIVQTLNKRTVARSLDNPQSHEVNNFEGNASDNSEETNEVATISLTETEPAETKQEKEADGSTPEHSEVKSKIAVVSESFSEQWGKFSSASRKLAGTMKDQFKKSKGHLQNFRSSSSDSKETETPTKTKSLPTDKSPNSAEDIEVTEGYFVGDARCYQIESDQAFSWKRTRFTDETASQLKTFGKEVDDEILPSSDASHRDGDSPCPCYICKTLGDGRFRRRRSSSVPPSDRKAKLNEAEETSENNPTISRYMSTPNISQGNCGRSFKDQNRSHENISSPQTAWNLRLSSLSSVEHYV